MADQTPGDVIEIQSVGGSTVDERGVMGRCPETVAPNHRPSRSRVLPHPLGGYFAHRLYGAGKRHTDTIQYRPSRSPQTVLWYTFQPARDDEVHNARGVSGVCLMRKFAHYSSRCSGIH